MPSNIKRKKSDIEFFNDKQIKKICEESVRKYKTGRAVYRLGDLIVFLLYTGLRIGEALALKWTDIDLESKRVRIYKNVSVVGDKIIIQNSTKTKSGERIIYLTRKAIESLENIREFNGNSEYVFARKNGNIVLPSDIDRMLRGILEKCGIHPKGVHVLRHSFASMLFRKGVDVKTVSEILGHSTVQLTYDTYIHLIEEQIKDAFDEIEEIDIG